MLIKYWPENTNIPFMKTRMIGFAFSIITTLLTVFLLMTRGLNLGVDFAGGSLIEIERRGEITVDAVRAALPFEAGVNEALEASGKALIVIRFGQAPKETLGAEFAALSPEDQAAQGTLMSKALVEKTLETKFKLNPATDFLRSESVGPKVSSELFRSGMIALGTAIMLMFVYITFRFNWKYAFGGIVALVHDLFLMVGLFSLTQMEFNLTSIAALLTITGYSINDTVVVFDRVREDRRKYKTMPAAELVDLATNSTLSRTMLTSVTTLLSAAAIMIFGGAVLKGMSIAIVFGIVLGTYSSIFVASAIVLLFGIDGGTSEKKKVQGFQTST
jgi:preprotein translocase subunit SecF